MAAVSSTRRGRRLVDDALLPASQQQQRLTDALVHKICDLVSYGASLTDAARLLGLPPQLVRDWMYFGKTRGGGRWPYDKLAAGVDVARLEYQARLIERARSL